MQGFATWSCRVFVRLSCFWANIEVSDMIPSLTTCKISPLHALLLVHPCRFPLPWAQKWKVHWRLSLLSFLSSHTACSCFYTIMVAKFCNFPVPKKGKLRSVLKRPATLEEGRLCPNPGSFAFASHGSLQMEAVSDTDLDSRTIIFGSYAARGWSSTFLGRVHMPSLWQRDCGQVGCYFW